MKPTVSIIGYTKTGADYCQHVIASTEEQAIAALEKKITSHWSEAESFLAYTTALQFYYRPAHTWNPVPQETINELIEKARAIVKEARINV